MKLHAMEYASHAKDMTAGQCVTNMYLLLVTNQKSLHTYAIPAVRESCALRGSTFILPNMQMQQSAGDGLKVVREST